MSKVLKTAKKVIKKIAKPLAIAAVIYLGGAALGAWGSPFQSINGIFAKGGTAAANAGAGAGAGSGAAAGTANTAAITNAVNTTMGVESAAAAGTAAGKTGLIASRVAPAGIPSMTVTGSAAPTFTATQTAGTAAGLTSANSLTAAGMDPNYTAPSMTNSLSSPFEQQISNGVRESIKAGAQPGIISRMMSGGMNFVKDNQLASAMLVSGAASAMSPDEIDVMREQEELRRQRDEEDRQRQAGNLNVGTITVPRYRQAPLKFTSTDQPIFNNGLINARRNV